MLPPQKGSEPASPLNPQTRVSTTQPSCPLHLLRNNWHDSKQPVHCMWSGKDPRLTDLLLPRQGLVGREQFQKGAEESLVHLQVHLLDQHLEVPVQHKINQSERLEETHLAYLFSTKSNQPKKHLLCEEYQQPNWTFSQTSFLFESVCQCASQTESRAKWAGTMCLHVILVLFLTTRYRVN